MVKVYRRDLDGFYEVSEAQATKLEQAGYSRTPQQSETVSSAPANDGRTAVQGMNIASNIFGFMPEDVLKAFSAEWVKNGNEEIAIAATRQTKAWKDNFGKLMRDDGTLVMDELSFMSVKASYKQTLAEVGIADFTDFEDEFTDMATGYETGDPVSAEEFQVRVDTVYAGVKDQIPEVEKLFRERYNLTLDQPTIFAALINPKIQDKVLAGEIATIQLQAQASSRGFTTSFARFDELRKMGLTAAQASQLYEDAGGMISQAASIGRDLSLETLEEATLGDELSSKRLQRISAELQSKQGIQLGSAKKGDEVTGLIAG